MKTLLTVKVDPAVKKNAQKTADSLGVPLSIAVNSFLKRFIRDKELVISESGRPSQYFKDVVREIHKELAEGKGKKFASTNALMQYLQS